MTSKNAYTAFAINSQGASTDVARGEWFTSISAAAAAARSEMGSGWKIKIVDEWDKVVKEFTIR